MAVSVMGVDYDNVDGIQASLAATFKAHRDNGDVLLNLNDAAQARAEGRKDGPSKNAIRAPCVRQPFPRHIYHADGRDMAVPDPEALEAAKEKGFREEPYPKVRVAPGDPGAEKAARIAQDLETAGKIASQNDLIVKLGQQVEALMADKKAKSK